MTANRITLLGPQRHDPIVKDVLDQQGIHGRLAVITGGWEEREEELDELDEHVGRETLNLRLSQRLQSVLAIDEIFMQALSDRNDRLRTAQTFYRKRLSSALEVARSLHGMTLPRMELLLAERADALRAVGYLDDHYLFQIRGIHEAFLELWDPRSRPAVAEVREHLEAELEDCAAVLIAGGNVSALLDQLSLLRVQPLIREKPVIAWSAGAMVVCEQIVLFHDNPPQGQSDPEIYDDGLGLAPGLVALPHASARLRLDDPRRVTLFAGRFRPATCVTLDAGCGATWDGQGWAPIGDVRRLTGDGQLVPLGAVR